MCWFETVAGNPGHLCRFLMFFFFNPLGSVCQYLRTVLLAWRTGGRKGKGGSKKMSRFQPLFLYESWFAGSRH